MCVGAVLVRTKTLLGVEFVCRLVSQNHCLKQPFWEVHFHLQDGICARGHTRYVNFTLIKHRKPGLGIG